MSISEKQIADLWLRILEGNELDSSEQKQLLDALDESPELREAFVQDVRIHRFLSLIAEDEQDTEGFAEQIRENLLLQHRQPAASDNSATDCKKLEESKSIFTERVRAKLVTISRRQAANRRGSRLLALAAALILLITGVSVIWRSPSAKPEVQLLACTGMVQSEGKQLQSGDTLPYGHALKTGQNGSARFRLPDGTECTMHESTALTVSDQGGLHVDRGVIEARAEKRSPDQSLAFTTPNARAEVLGTELILLSLKGKTRLDVRQGRVRLVRRSDERSIMVKAGEFSTVSASTESLTVHPSSGRLMSSRFDGRIFREYAQIYEAGHPVLESLNFDEGAALQELSPQELYKHRVKTQFDSDTTILVSDPPEGGRFSTFLKLHGILPKFGFEFRLPSKASTPDALRIRYPLYIDARYDEQLEESHRPHDLRLFIPGATAPKANRSIEFPSVRFPSVNMRDFIETYFGKWRAYIADLVQVGQLDDGRRIYEYRVSLEENGQVAQHGIIAVDKIDRIGFRLRGVHIRLGPTTISSGAATIDKHGE